MSLPSADHCLAIIELQNAIAAAGLHADEVMAVVVERAASLTGASAGAIALADGDELVQRAATRGARPPQLARQAIAERRAVTRDGALCVPLLYGEAAVGALELTGGATDDSALEAVRLLAQIVAIALHRAYTYPKPRPDTLHDVVTGLANRRAFDERIAAELQRNRRYGHSFSLAFLQLDGFESVNDRLGQAAGDEALREIAAIMKGHTRVIDACFRVAAEDFAIVMPGTSLEGAGVVAERCRAAILEANLARGGVSASAGVVEAVRDESADDLGARAQAAVVADKAARAARA